MVAEVYDNIYTFAIDMPNNPLQYVNCYVVRGRREGRNLLIDTGFRIPSCQEALFRGIRELGLELEETDVLLTHCHSDHSGNAEVLQRRGCRIFLSQLEKHLLDNPHLRMASIFRRYIEEGMPKEHLEGFIHKSPAIQGAPTTFPGTGLVEGDMLSYGGYDFRAIITPGHSPAHVCLYSEADRLLFVGDAVLFDITPNITPWPTLPDALGSYLLSLRRIAGLNADKVFPGHRTTGGMGLEERVEQLLKHHQRRMDEILQVLTRDGGRSCWEIAGEMTWSVRNLDWDRFPPEQRWFAMGEAMAHLDHLRLSGKVRRETDKGVHVYHAL